MKVSPVYLWLTALITGLLLVPVCLVLIFFPLFNISQVLIFFAACFIIALVFKPRSWLWMILVISPVWILVLRIVLRLGLANIERGIGTGHALSLILIPLAAWAGMFFGRKFAGASPAS